MNQKLVSIPSLVSQKISNEKLVAVRLIKEVLLLDKKAYVDISILELSKLWFMTSAVTT